MRSSHGVYFMFVGAACFMFAFKGEPGSAWGFMAIPAFALFFYGFELLNGSGRRRCGKNRHK